MGIIKGKRIDISLYIPSENEEHVASCAYAIVETINNDSNHLIDEDGNFCGYADVSNHVEDVELQYDKYGIMWEVHP